MKKVKFKDLEIGDLISFDEGAEYHYEIINISGETIDVMYCHDGHSCDGNVYDISRSYYENEGFVVKKAQKEHEKTISKKYSI